MQTIIIGIIIVLSFINVIAQEHHQHERDTIKQQQPSQHQNANNQMSNYSEPFQKGSGTSWLPKSSPMNAYMSHTKNWMLMFHGNLFIRYNSQDISDKGSRGDSKFDAPNWFMLMAENMLDKNNKLKFSFMTSFDPAFVGGNGYPLLFQSGESWEGKPLVDRQHPHDFISELSVEYTHLFNNDFAVNTYFGYSGEPSIGPVAFMHRPSAANNPDSPLGHHWQDATHITFGVATLGFRFFNYKIEGSVFTGREPNEQRWGFDKPKFDSYSGRISGNPSKELSLQTSYAYLKSPEPLSPEENPHRTTASILHAKKLSAEIFINSAVIWGYNYVDRDHKEHSVTLESDFNLIKFSVYGRYEWIEKSAEELDLSDFEHGRIFRINALTIGTNYSLLQYANTRLLFGIQGSIFSSEEALQYLYGKNPLSLEIYLRISPASMHM